MYHQMLWIHRWNACMHRNEEIYIKLKKLGSQALSGQVPPPPPTITKMSIHSPDDTKLSCGRLSLYPIAYSCKKSLSIAGRWKLCLVARAQYLFYHGGYRGSEMSSHVHCPWPKWCLTLFVSQKMVTFPMFLDWCHWGKSRFRYKIYLSNSS